MPYREKNGKWRGVVYQGKKRIATKKFPRKREAVAWEEEFRKSLKQQVPIGMGLVDFGVEYLDMAREHYSNKTYQEKTSCIKRFLEFLGGDRLVSQVLPQDVHRFLLLQKKARSANAANKDRKNLLSLWNWGQRILNVSDNPVARTEVFPHKKALQYTPPEKDVLEVLAASTGIDRIFLETYLQTGARRGEIFNLTWDDVDFTASSVTLWTQKTRDGSPEPRTIKIGPRLCADLKRLWKNRKFPNLPYVFVDDQPGPHFGKPYSARRRFLKGLCKRAGVQPFGFHALRRFFASSAHRGQFSTKTIQEMLGHHNLRTTELYIKQIGQDQDAVASHMETIVNKAGNTSATPKAKKGVNSNELTP